MPRNENFQKWVNEVMLKVIENLGLDVDKTSYKLFESTDKLMTTLCYVLLQSENKTAGQNEEISMILKKPFQDCVQISHINPQFHNEILFYQMYTRPNENYARCFYVDERPPIDSVIALENVNKRGYHPCPYKFAPLEYTLAAMRELGRFHGKGYVMKELQREKFFDIVTRLQEVRYLKMTENMYEILCNINSPRVVEYLRRHGHDAVFCDKMEVFLSNVFDEVMMKVVQPVEPLSTLCHGDFTLDNILFKTEDDGQYRALLIDFALFRHSSPVVDLSTYLCLSCSNEMRKDKFSEIMRAYHDALKQYLLEAGIWNKEKYSYEALLDDFRRGGLFGFVLASFYFPVYLGYTNPYAFIQDVSSIGLLESIKKYKNNGGDEMSKILAEMLLHLRDLGCLERFL